MAQGVNSVLKRTCKNEGGKGIGSRRIFAPHFKLQVLDSYRNDADCKGNQRATARKYGIHRRQIQKWLQAENALRNSVKEKVMSLNGGRQPDAGYGGGGVGCEERQRSTPPSPPAHPCASALPIDYTVPRHHRLEGIPASPNVAVASTDDFTSLATPLPMDLSLKRPSPTVDAEAPSAAVSATPATPFYCSAPLTPPPSSAGSTSSLRDETVWRCPTPKTDPDVWDLSTKGQKRKCTSPVADTKPVKLFKPYLDDIKEEDAVDRVKSEHTPYYEEPACRLDACCSIPTGTDSTYYYNNNYVCDAEYNGYTLHELKPYYYYCRDYCPCDYEISSCYYEDLSYGGQGMVPMKPRQRYSLDFKLSAIDCYYQDSVCKGNQRAVANKYNIHRRQVQKWLKQAEELRTRNETVKQIHAVR